MQTFVWFKEKSKVWNTLIKICLGVLLLWALYQQLAGKVQAKELWATLNDLIKSQQLVYLFLTIALMPLNWILEAMKWREFIPARHQLSIGRSILAIFSGVSISLFTPNRTGDYFGRILLVKAEANWNVFSATLAANICQLLALLSFGWLGLLYYSQKVLTIPWQDYKVFLIIALTGTILLFLSLLYVKRLIRIIANVKILRKINVQLEGYLEVFTSYGYTTLLKAIGLAALRYGTYALQYYLMLQFAGIEVPWLLGFAGIASIFLVQSSIPLPPVLGLLARGEIALLVWGDFESDPLRILAASFGLFIINLAVPALVGIVAIARVNILKSLGYEKNDP